MNDQHHHQSHFDSAFPIYYTRLKEVYEEGVKTAVDKEYAKTFYQTILCEENEALPQKTVFFVELRTLFDHFNKLYGGAAVLWVMEHIEPIRRKSIEAVEQLERFCEGLGDPDYLQLPERYDEQLDYGTDPGEIIDQERMVIGLSDRQIVEILALYSATRRMLAELNAGIASQSSETQSVLDRDDRFTIPQKVLAMFYLLEAVGIKEGTVALTDCARLLHRIFSVPIPAEMSNSDIYKLFKRPHGEFDHKTRKDLKKILPSFESLLNQDIIDRIESHVKDCKG